MKVIRKANDFVLGILMILLSVGLFFGKVTSNVPEVSQGGPISRPDVWLQMIAAILFVISVILVVSSLNFGKKDIKEEKFQFKMGSTAMLTIAALIIYAALLPIVGFVVVTLVITSFLTALYTLEEEKLSIKKIQKADIIRIGRKSLITGVIMLGILWIVFGKILAIQLP